MAVVETTAAGYRKEEYDGRTSYRGPDGGFVSKEEYEASKSNVRITATVSVDTGRVSHSGDSTQLEVEIGGVFNRGTAPNGKQIWRRLSSIMSQAKQQVPIRNRAGAEDMNIETASTQRDATGWGSGTLSINNRGDWSPAPYEVDAEQEFITDPRWQG